MDLDKPTVDRYLAILREIGASVCLTDCHVHPFEVMFDACTYEPDPQLAGVYRSGKIPYLPATSGPVSLGALVPPVNDMRADLVERVLLLSMRRLYSHTGPQCWRDHGEPAGIRRYALLPVAQPGRTADARMHEMAEMFGDDPQFILGYSLPNTLAPEEVAPDVLRAVETCRIRVLKVHPTLSGHDMTSTQGIRQVNALLEAAKRSALPVILHGGLSPSTRYAPEACQQGAMENLARLDFGLTDSPVVIAHAGAFAIDVGEYEQRVLPLLRQLLSRFDHLLVDTSALSAEILSLVLGKVDPRRIVFGSDAFYEASWKAAVKLYWALEQQLPRPGDLFAQIAGDNARELFGKGD